MLTAEANQWLATGHMCRGRTMQRRHAEYSAMGQGFGTEAIKYVSTPDALAARLRPQHLCKLPLMHTSLSSYTPMSCKGTGGGSGVRPQPGGHTLNEGRVRWFKPCARHTIRLPCPSATEPTLLRARHRLRAELSRLGLREIAGFGTLIKNDELLQAMCWDVTCWDVSSASCDIGCLATCVGMLAHTVVRHT